MYKIIAEVFYKDPLKACNSKLGTDYRSKKFYKEKAHFHYVPIIETFKAMFKNKSFDDINLKVPRNEGGALKYFRDGFVFQSNSFFLENVEALSITLYMDSFEIVNPIGSVRKKCKILAMYLTLGNLPDYIRYRINLIQLVLLCKEKDFSLQKLYGRLVKDLLKVDNQGNEIYLNKVVKGSVVLTSDDNLRAHSLEGFLEKFSTSNSFCRFCLITRPTFLGTKNLNLETIEEEDLEKDDDKELEKEEGGEKENDDDEDEDEEKEEEGKHDENDEEEEMQLGDNENIDQKNKTREGL